MTDLLSLKQFRKKYTMSREQLAGAFGVSIWTVERMELKESKTGGIPLLWVLALEALAARQRHRKDAALR